MPGPPNLEEAQNRFPAGATRKSGCCTLLTQKRERVHFCSLKLLDSQSLLLQQKNTNEVPQGWGSPALNPLQPAGTHQIECYSLGLECPSEVSCVQRWGLGKATGSRDAPEGHMDDHAVRRWPGKRGSHCGCGQDKVSPSAAPAPLSASWLPRGTELSLEATLEPANQRRNS